MGGEGSEVFLTADELVEPESERGTKHWWRVFHRTAIFPKDLLRALVSPMAFKGETRSRSGIYFLWFGPALLYVGQSRCVVSRIYQHEDARDGLRAAKAIPFNRATFLELADSDWITTDRERRARDQVELAYIRKYRPPYNVKGLQ
jgi:hypothetical protein